MENNEIKPAIAYEKIVIYNNSEYTVHGLLFFKIPKRRKIGYSLILLDLNKNSTITVDPAKVKIKE